MLGVDNVDVAVDEVIFVKPLTALVCVFAILSSSMSSTMLFLDMVGTILESVC